MAVCRPPGRPRRAGRIYLGPVLGARGPRGLSSSRGVAQTGSAPEWGSGGPGFKSRRPDSRKARNHAGFRASMAYHSMPPLA